MKCILVTGGAGFIGTNLCMNLLSKGNSVICVDNFYTAPINNMIRNLSEKYNRFQIINKSVTKFGINDLDSNIKIDEIYHLACPASPPIYQRDPIFTLDTNYIGTKNMLEIANIFKCKILLASTSEIYGDPNNDLQKEDYWGNVNPIGERSCYDEGKRISETLFYEYRKKYQLDAKIVRIFNTYGPYMNKNDGRVVSNFINQAIRNKDITIYGDGSQTRSFCYISDLICGITTFMNSTELGPINIGNPEEITVLELAKIIIEYTNSKSKIVFYDLPPDDPKKRKPCIKKARKLLKWIPIVPLEVGLQSTVNYYLSLI